MTPHADNGSPDGRQDDPRGKGSNPLKSAWAKVRGTFGAGSETRRGERQADAGTSGLPAERREERADPLAGVGRDEPPTDIHDVGRGLEGTLHTPLDDIGDEPVIAPEARPTGSVSAAGDQSTGDDRAAPGDPQVDREREAATPALNTAAVDEAPTVDTPTGTDGAAPLDIPAPIDQVPTLDESSVTADEATRLDEPAAGGATRDAGEPETVEAASLAVARPAVEDASSSTSEEAPAAAAASALDETPLGGGIPAVEEAPEMETALRAEKERSAAADAPELDEAAEQASEAQKAPEDGEASEKRKASKKQKASKEQKASKKQKASKERKASKEQQKAPAAEDSSTAEKGSAAGGPDYDELTVDELRDLATQRDITGRWEMSKDELIAALSRGEGGDERYDELTVEELRDRATQRDITGRWEMSKDELIAALKQTSD